MAKLFAVRASTDGMATRARLASGKFSTFQTEMNEAHRRMAANAAHQIQKVLIDEIKATGRRQIDRTRLGQGEDALVNAIIDPANRRIVAGSIGFQGFEVMDTEYLDKLVVGYYYRDLEIGTSKFVGRQYHGYFYTGEGKGASGPLSSRRGLDPLMPILGGGGGLNAPEKGGFTPTRVQYLNTISRQTLGPDAHEALHSSNVGMAGGAYGHARGTTTTNAIPTSSLFAPLRAREGERGRGALITIRRPIRPYHYVETGMANWNASGDQLFQSQAAALRAGLDVSGTQIIPPSLNE